MRNSLRSQLTLLFIGLALVPLMVVASVQARVSFTTQERQALELEKQVVRRVSSTVGDYVVKLEDELTHAAQFENLTSLTQREQNRILLRYLTHQDFYFTELVLLDNKGMERAYVSRLRTLSPGELKSRYDAPEFMHVSWYNVTYYSPVSFDPVLGEPYIIVAVPIHSWNLDVLDGVLVAKARMKSMWDLLGELQLGEGETVFITDDTGRVIAHRNPSAVFRGLTYTVPDQDGRGAGLEGGSVILARDEVRFGTQTFKVVAQKTTSSALALGVRLLVITGIVMVVTLIVAVIAGLTAIRRIVQPVESMAATARSIAAGDLSQQVNITRRDEIGVLAQAFNSMTAQLREFIGTLEQRVADRTKAIETSAEVSRRLSTILNQGELVKEVVEQLKAGFSYYHAHIYLFDEGRQNLVMVGGTGDAGQTMLARGHKLAAGKGLVGRAAESNAPVLVSDTTQDPGWLPNPLLPETRSELAIPIAIGDQVLGVLDIQQDRVSGLTQEDVTLLQSIANQVAIALQNARAYAHTERQVYRETLISTIVQKIRSTTNVEDAMMVAVRELGRAVGAPHTRLRLHAAVATGKSSQPQTHDLEEAL